jgi:hypothetical protein
VVLQVLNGLPALYATKVSIIEEMKTLPTLDEILSTMLPVELKETSQQAEDIALFSRADRSRNGRDGGSTSTGGSMSGGGTSGGFGRETRDCHYCGLRGHLKVDCRKKKRDDAARANGAILLTASAEDVLFFGDKGVWVLDSGASAHISNDRSVMTNFRPVSNRFIQYW